MLFGYFTLLVALVIEAVGAYYSITGLAAIFSGAVIPILIMGASLEVGKVTAAVWLKLNWERASIAYKLYLVPAVAFLMLLTSMGIFGFLSKAHSDQNLISGDSMAKVAIYDEKIKTEKENIEANRKALKQMDEGVDQVLGRSTDEKGADKAVALRRAQQKERSRLQAEILQSQKSIAELNDARAPLAAEVRKVENEVGPIKYIAALIYGDNPDANILERAVRWVIILIVAVFDPLALVLILAAQQSLRWARDEEQERRDVEQFTEDAAQEVLRDIELQEEQTPVEVNKHTQAVSAEGEPAPHHPDTHPYLRQGFGKLPEGYERIGPMVAKPETVQFKDSGEHPKDTMEYAVEQDYSYIEEDNKRVQEEMDALDRLANKEPIQEDPAIESEVSTQPPEPKILAAGLDERPGDYVTPPTDEWTGPMKEVVEEIIDPNTRIKTFNHTWVPDLDAVADNAPQGHQANADFGTAFPANPEKGDMYVRVDFLPPRLFKYNGAKWMEVDKTITDSHFSEEYIKHLIDKINSGEYSVEDLSESEQEQIRDYLNRA